MFSKHPTHQGFLLYHTFHFTIKLQNVMIPFSPNIVIFWVGIASIGVSIPPPLKNTTHSFLPSPISPLNLQTVQALGNPPIYWFWPCQPPPPQQKGWRGGRGGRCTLWYKYTRLLKTGEIT